MATKTKTGKTSKLGERLVNEGLLTPDQLTLALSEQRRNGGALGTILEKLGFVDQAEIARISALDIRVEFMDLGHIVIDAEVLQLIPREFAKQHQLIPIDRDGYTLTVAMSDPYDVMTIDAIEKMTNFRVEVITASSQELHEIIEEQYAETAAIDLLIESALSASASDSDDKSGMEPPVVRLVDQIIALAVRKRATDLHFEPQETVLTMRLRIDGILHEEHLLPKALQLVIAARLKIMGALDVTEHRLPQDGKIHFKLGHRWIDLRISSLPTQYGESIVIRVLDKSATILKLDNMGLSKNDKKILRESIHKPHGIILTTGPTGSGKTTTLYAALSEMDAIHKSIFTLEDPVEYSFTNVRQTQVNAGIGMTFANGLRALLRQDPDVILVGEIRDEETAQLATRAALTGHLVLSTLHTNSACGAIPRLINMGSEPYLIASTLLAVIAQRLVRRICAHCAEPQKNIEKFQETLNFEPLPKDKFRIGVGCDRCNQTGYLGRVAIYEILHSQHLREYSINQDVTEHEIRTKAMASGMQTMLQDGIAKARSGICSLEDIARTAG